MDYLIHTLLNKAQTKLFIEQITSDSAHWEEGKKTAGSHAAKVKQNIQLEKNSKIAIKSSEQIIDLIAKDKLLKSYCLPKKVHGVMFSQSSTGDGYGTHVDNAYMNSGRSDLSFTLFLNSPKDYQGGELCIQTLQGKQQIKLEAGQIVIYPSTSLHSVQTIKEGRRFACIGWIQSYIASNEDRSILFGMDAGARGLLAKHGQSEELDLIFQSYNNLLRRLGN